MHVLRNYFSSTRSLLFLFTVPDDVIKWKHFPRYWPFVWGIDWSPMNFPHKGLWRGALVFSLICAWISGWVNNRKADDLRHHRAHYDVTVMWKVYTHSAYPPNTSASHPRELILEVLQNFTKYRRTSWLISSPRKMFKRSLKGTENRQNIYLTFIVIISRAWEWSAYHVYGFALSQQIYTQNGRPIWYMTLQTIARIPN